MAIIDRGRLQRVVDLRGTRGWSQAHLAELLDVSRQTVIAIETGKYDPSLPLALKMARLFKKPVEKIFGVKPPPLAA